MNQTLCLIIKTDIDNPSQTSIFNSRLHCKNLQVQIRKYSYVEKSCNIKNDANLLCNVPVAAFINHYVLLFY